VQSAEQAVPTAIGVDGPRLARPTADLPLAQLVNLSVYWLGINAIWAGLGNVVYQARFKEMFGAAYAPGYVAILDFIPVIVAILVMPTVAIISDYTVTRWGRRKPYILIGGLLDTVFLFGIASSNDVLAIIAFVMLLQFSSNFAQGPFQGYVPDLVPRQQVGLASGLMGVMIIIGNVVGTGIATLGVLGLKGNPYAPGPEAGAYAQQAFFLPTLGLGLIEFVTMLLLVATVADGREGPDRNGRSWVSIGLSAWGTDILRERSYVWLLVSRLFFLMVPALLTGVGFFYLNQAMRMPVDDVAGALLVISLIIGTTTGLVTLPAAKLSDRTGRKRMIYTSIGVGSVGMAGVAVAPSFAITVLALIAVGFSMGSFLAVDWALMTDIIPKATTGRYMGISNVATGISGPIGLGIGGAVISVLVLAGLPAGADPTTDAALSSFYELAPRIAMALTLVFFAISALALTRVDERRRDD